MRVMRIVLKTRNKMYDWKSCLSVNMNIMFGASKLCGSYDKDVVSNGDGPDPPGTWPSKMKTETIKMVTMTGDMLIVFMRII